MSKPTIPLPETGTVVVMDTDWRGYLQTAKALEHRRFRLTYDRGKLEIMSPSLQHEQIKEFLAILVQLALDVFEIDYRPGGSTRFNRRERKRGLEPDTCFWISHWSAMLGLRRWMPRVHPPPDLAIELEVTTHMLDRFSVYESLEVPEIWRWTAQNELRFLHLTDGEYVEHPRSHTFPQLPPDEIVVQVEGAENISTRQWKRDVVAWLQRQVV